MDDTVSKNEKITPKIRIIKWNGIKSPLYN